MKLSEFLKKMRFGAPVLCCGVAIRHPLDGVMAMLHYIDGRFFVLLSLDCGGDKPLEWLLCKRYPREVHDACNAPNAADYREKYTDQQIRDGFWFDTEEEMIAFVTHVYKCNF